MASQSPPCTPNRVRLKQLVARSGEPGPAFWLGNPDPATWPMLLAAVGADTPEAARAALGDSLVWVLPQVEVYRLPGAPPLPQVPWPTRGEGSPWGCLASCEDPAEVAAMEWPTGDGIDFGSTIADLEAAGDRYRASGIWACFFHVVADYFGMEEYFVKMHTNPGVVDAVTERVCTFFLEANRKLFAQAGPLIDACFLGNDFGTQRGLMVSPAMLRRFVLPWVARFAEEAHGFGLQVMLHSCGAVGELIDDFIAMGVDALHPLQALATGMDAESLARRFGGRIAFVGGVDTQQLLIRGTPAQVEAEVQRLRQVLGPYYIVSPSHEALLPDVNMANVLAMARAAHRP